MNNTTLVKDNASYSNVTNILFLTYSICLIVPNTLAFISLQKAKRIPKKIKLPIMNLTFSDILTGLSFVVHGTLLTVDLPRPLRNTTCYFQQIWTLTSAFASFSIIGGMTIDRCICLYYEYVYLTRVTTKIIRIWQGVNWGVSFFFAILIFVDTNWDAPCYYRFIVGRYGRIMHIFYGIFFRFISAVAFILICIKIKGMRDSERLNRVTNSSIYRTTYKVLVIGLTFHGMYLPLFCHHIFVLIYPDKVETAQNIYIVVSSLPVLNSFINPFIYVWRFPECRLQLKIILCFWNKELIEREENKRKHLMVGFLKTAANAS